MQAIFDRVQQFYEREGRAMQIISPNESALPPSYDDVMAAEKDLSKPNAKLFKSTPTPPPLPMLLPPPAALPSPPASQLATLPVLNEAHGSADNNDDDDDCRILFMPNNDNKDGTVSA